MLTVLEGKDGPGDRQVAMVMMSLFVQCGCPYGSVTPTLTVSASWC